MTDVQFRSIPSSAAFIFPILKERVKLFQKSPTELMNIITETVANYYHIRQSLLYHKTRKREIAFARQACMYLIRKTNKKLSLKTIGEYFGGRDHTTVIASLRTVKDLIDTDEQIRCEMRELNDLI